MHTLSETQSCRPSTVPRLAERKKKAPGVVSVTPTIGSWPDHSSIANIGSGEHTHTVAAINQGSVPLGPHGASQQGFW